MGASEHTDRQPQLGLFVGIGLLALTIRLIFSFIAFPEIAGSLNLGRDPDYFGELAQNWANGLGYVFYAGDAPSTFRGPGYPAVLAAIYLGLGSLFPAISIVQSLMGALICVVMVAIGTRVAGVRTGAIAGLLGAVHPLLVWYSPRLQYEYLFTLLLALAILWFLRMSDGGLRLDALASGLLFGAASLVNQVVILLPLALWTTLFLMRARKAETLSLASIALVTMAAVILPWTARNYLVSGRFIPVHSGGITQFVKGNYEFEFYAQAPLRSVEIMRISEAHMARVLALNEQLDVRDEGMDQILLPHAVAFLRNGPHRVVFKIFGQIPRFWYLSESPLKSYALLAIQLPLLALALMGTVHLLLANRSLSLALAILLVPIAYFNLVYAVTHVEGRYSTPILPFVIVLAATSLAAAIERIRDRQLLRPSKRLIRAR